MGHHFALVADHLITPLADNLQGDRCDGCGLSKPQYFLFGPTCYVALGLRGRLVPDAIQEYEIQRACLKCTKASFVRPSWSAWKTAHEALRSPGKSDSIWSLRRWLLAREIGRTPPYAFFAQQTDWPICCRRCTEYRGYPADENELRKIPNIHEYWENGLGVQESPIDDLVETEDPTMDINLFGCERCSRCYYTHQIT